MYPTVLLTILNNQNSPFTSMNHFAQKHQQKILHLKQFENKIQVNTKYKYKYAYSQLHSEVFTSHISSTPEPPNLSPFFP